MSLSIKTGVGSLTSGISRPMSLPSQKSSLKAGKVYGVVTTKNSPTPKQFSRAGEYGGMGSVLFIDYDNAKNIISIIQSQTSEDELDFQTFINIFGNQEVQSESSLKDLYDLFDPNGTNCFGPEDFERVCDLVGEKFTPQ
jgi:hypothetical protein